MDNEKLRPLLGSGSQDAKDKRVGNKRKGTFIHIVAGLDITSAVEHTYFMSMASVTFSILTKGSSSQKSGFRTS